MSTENKLNDELIHQGRPPLSAKDKLICREIDNLRSDMERLHQNLKALLPRRDEA